jgi:hypothetical protein
MGFSRLVATTIPSAAGPMLWFHRLIPTIRGYLVQLLAVMVSLRAVLPPPLFKLRILV